MSSLAEQTYAFLMTILAGGVIGFLFDLYRVFRSMLRPKQLGTAVTDLLFWIVVTPTVFAMLLAGNWGELRFYVLVGLAIGLLLYFQALSAAVLWLFMGALKRLGQGLSWGALGLARVLTFPFAIIGGAFGRRRRAVWSKRRWSGMGAVAPSPRVRMAWQRFSFSRLFHR